eukprot:scaffold49234_cov72-Phaeocystis_antarctica.AAC.4
MGLTTLQQLKLARLGARALTPCLVRAERRQYSSRIEPTLRGFSNRLLSPMTSNEHLPQTSPTTGFLSAG